MSEQRALAVLRLHGHAPDNRCIDITKQLTDLHPEATLTQITGLLDGLIQAVGWTDIALHDAWIEITQQEPEPTNCKEGEASANPDTE